MIRSARESLKSALDQKSSNDPGQRVFVRADKAVSYGDLMDVMNLLRQIGYLKIALVGLEGTPESIAPPPPTPGAPPNSELQ